MNTNKVILKSVLLFSLCTQVANANIRNSCQNLSCFAPPSGVFTYASSEQTFAYAASPWPEDLVGSWIVVGSTQAPGIYPVRMLTEEYNPNGVALDPEHSNEKAVLNFVQGADLNGRHNVEVSLTAVNRSTLVEDVSLDQGPFVASLGIDQACFGLEYGQPVNVPGVGISQGYVNDSCRVLQDGNLICSLELSAPYNSFVAGYVLLKRNNF
jgi:hypothetical protein